MNSPLVTIAIPNYNYAAYVVSAIESAERQTYPNIEIIISDDCSSDNSVAVIREWIQRYNGPRRIEFLEFKKNMGLGKACNMLLAAANGKYYQELDADDLLVPDKILKQVAIMEQNPNVAIIYSDAIIMDENGHYLDDGYLDKIGYKEAPPQGMVFDKLFEFNFLPLPTLLVRTDMAKEVGGYHEYYRVQDYCLWLRIAARYPVIFSDSIVAFYRKHNFSMSTEPYSKAKCISDILSFKYEYFQNLKKPNRIIFRKNLHNSIPTLIRYKDSQMKKWIMLNLKLNPSPKAIFYTIAGFTGFPFWKFIKR